MHSAVRVLPVHAIKENYFHSVWCRNKSFLVKQGYFIFFQSFKIFWLFQTRPCGVEGCNISRQRDGATTCESEGGVVWTVLMICPARRNCQHWAGRGERDTKLLHCAATLLCYSHLGSACRCTARAQLKIGWAFFLYCVYDHHFKNSSTHKQTKPNWNKIYKTKLIKNKPKPNQTYTNDQNKPNLT